MEFCDKGDTREAVDGIEDYWAPRWKEGQTGWHLNKVNPYLIQFLDHLTGVNNCRRSVVAEPNLQNAPKKFFLPLCGATLDIAYLYRLGYSVFGVEGVKDVVEDLSDRDKLGLKYNDRNSTFESDDGRIVIYVGDVLECPIEKWGPMDCVFDRASLIALNHSIRSPYVDIMKRSVQVSSSQYHDFRILLEIVRYDQSFYPGPPRSISGADMDELFGKWTNIELLSKLPAGILFPKLPTRLPEGSECDLMFYLLKPKAQGA